MNGHFLVFTRMAGMWVVSLHKNIIDWSPADVDVVYDGFNRQGAYLFKWANRIFLSFSQPATVALWLDRIDLQSVGGAHRKCLLRSYYASDSTSMAFGKGGVGELRRRLGGPGLRSGCRQCRDATLRRFPRCCCFLTTCLAPARSSRPTKFPLLRSPA